MSTSPSITEAQVLSDVVSSLPGDIPPELARSILSMHFSEKTRAQIRELLELNNADKISDQQRSDLGVYLRVGQFLDLLQARAALTLQCE